MISRRYFIKSSVGAAVTSQLQLIKPLQASTDLSKLRILVRGMRPVHQGKVFNFNIGTTAHAPGDILAMQRHLPDAEFVLWASAELSGDIAEMMHKRLPDVKIVTGGEELNEAIEWAEVLLHDSGSGLPFHRDLTRFAERTGKPYGAFGIGYQRRNFNFMNKAMFMYFRDSVSLSRALERDNLQTPHIGWAPDGAFACDVRDDAAALDFMAKHGLEEGAFVCCIGRLRHTPRWDFYGRPVNRSSARRNEEMKDQDHAPLRETVVAVVRETGMKVLLCPEDRTQMAVNKEMIVDRLPADVRASVVWREHFWGVGEAISTFVRSAGLFGLEMHSPVLCVANGVPAIVCRFEELTSKGFMWSDIGLGDWLFDFDKEEDRQRLKPAVLDMIADPGKAREKVVKAQEYVNNAFGEAFKTLSDMK